MYPIEMTYEDFDGNERTETFLFNLTETEVTTMQLTTAGGLEAHIKKIMSTQDGPEVIRLFQELILRAYGEKSPDGKKFIKIDPVDHHKLSDDFEATNAYSDLFMKLCTDADEAIAFVKGILPKKASDAIEEKQKAGNLTAVK